MRVWLVAMMSLWLLGCTADSHKPLPGVAMEGRYAHTDEGLVLGFPGTRLVMDAPGPVRLDVEALGDQVRLDVREDGGAWRRIDLAPGPQTLTLGQDAPHRLEIIRRNEDWQGALRIRSLEPVSGAFDAAPALPERKLLFIGDSITAGAGTDVAFEDAGLGKPLDNARLAFPRILADRLDAQVHHVAYGGRGIIRDWRGYPTGQDSVLNAPAFYGLASPGLDQPWDPQAFVPDAVVIGLGTNDFNPGVPDREAFVSAYAGFVARLRSDYPDAPILILNSPMTDGERAEVLSDYLDDVAARSGDGAHRLDTQRYEGRPSVVGHPTDAQHIRIADEIEPVLRGLLAR